ncbi:MAG: UDP-N-acetylglucosamine 2-epimerase (non-hydrolyzing), partial [Clostridiales bacterium]|nr:UDP-N-acetylglucosamine 2-epimerase (non-hydrolyzing) [Clostridiales bacterium]
VTARTLEGMRRVLSATRPDILLVHGDTTTSFAAALAAYYEGVTVGHVEAGLRTYNIDAPYPEEFNRQAIDIVSRWSFAPTETSRDNLIREGKKAETIFVTGNTEIDAVRMMVRGDYSHPELDWASDCKLVILTAHRRETLGDTMSSMFRAIRRVVDAHEDVKLIYPVHLNPAVRSAAEVFRDHPRIRLIEPLPVSDFDNFMARAHLILTDSGGIQEAAPALNKPVIVLRDETERPEGIEAGTLLLAGTDETAVHDAFTRLLEDDELYRALATAKNPYGDGFTSKIIADILETG